MTLPLFSRGPRSCCGWFSCRGVIVCSVVCCTSLSLALKCVSARCLLTLCLTATGSYMKPACRKNTFHINLLGPLVETFALMNHDLSKNAGVFAQWGSFRRTVRLSRLFVRLFSMSLGNGLWFLAGQWSIVPASVLLRGLPGQMESVRHCSSSRAEQRVHGCQGYGRTRDIFHRSGERRKGAERTDKQRTEEEISVFRCQSGYTVCRVAKMFWHCRIFLQACCLHSLAGGGVASTLHTVWQIYPTHKWWKYII